MGKTTARKKVPKPIVTQHQRQPDKPPADQKASRAAPKRQRAALGKTINVTAATLQQQIQAAVVEEDYLLAGRLKHQLDLQQLELALTSAPKDPSRPKKKRRKQMSGAGRPLDPSMNHQSIKGFALGQTLTTALHAEGYVTPTSVPSTVASSCTLRWQRVRCRATVGRWC